MGCAASCFRDASTTGMGHAVSSSSNKASGQVSLQEYVDSLYEYVVRYFFIVLLRLFDFRIPVSHILASLTCFTVTWSSSLLCGQCDSSSIQNILVESITHSKFSVSF